MDFNDYFSEVKKISPLDLTTERLYWAKFKDEGDLSARQKIIRAYQPLVLKCALPYRTLDGVMDLVQEGIVGLLEAAENYDYRRGVAFSLFAVHRIKGRMVDWLRRERPRDAAVLTLDAVIDANGTTGLEIIPDPAAPPLDRLVEAETWERLHEALARLPLNERTVLDSLYFAGITPNDIASGLSLSLSSIYRLQRSGIRRIRGMMARFMKKN